MLLVNLQVRGVKGYFRCSLHKLKLLKCNRRHLSLICKCRSSHRDIYFMFSSHPLPSIIAQFHEELRYPAMGDLMTKD